MAKSIQWFRNAFLKVRENEDEEIKNMQLASLMTGMEKEFEIPALNDEVYNNTYPVVIALYKDMSNARVF